MPKNQVVELRTTLEVEELARLFRATLNESSKQVEFENFQTTKDAFAGIDRLRFDVFASGKDGFLGKKLWGLRITIYDDGEYRKCALTVASSSFKEMLYTSFSQKDIIDRYGALGKINFQKGLGQEKAQLVIGSLQRVDPQLQVA